MAVTESLFDYRRTGANSSISDSEAMLWAQSTIQDVKEELESEKIGDLVEAIHNWIQLTKFHNNRQLLLYKDGCPRVDGTMFETISVALLATGNIICRVVKNSPSAQKETLNLLNIDYEKVKRVYDNIKESYNEWLGNISNSSQSEILSALECGD